MPTQRGAIVLADISGYTEFIAGTELEHSREILAELLEAVTFCTKRDLAVAQIEGDAVFWLADGLRPMVLEGLERSFVAFHRRLRDIDAVTKCPCRACRRVGALTLKFVLHVGEYVRQRVAGSDHFVGSDIVLAHRLLKNSVPSREYVLVTAAALAALPEPARAEFQPHEERYEHIGLVPVAYLELAGLRDSASTYERAPVRPDNAHLRASRVYEEPAERLWAWLDAKPHRLTWLSVPLWMGWGTVSAEVEPGAQGGLVGAELHCYHGSERRNLTIAHVVSQGEREVTLHVIGDHGGYYVTERLESISSGTSRLEACYRWETDLDPGLLESVRAGAESQFDLIARRYADTGSSALPTGVREWG